MRRLQAESPQVPFPLAITETVHTRIELPHSVRDGFVDSYSPEIDVERWNRKINKISTSIATSCYKLLSINKMKIIFLLI